MQKIQLLLAELDKVIAGYTDVKRKIVIALLADGHVLLESVPGLAKTTLISALQVAIDGSKKARIQMTSDIKPTDIVGVEIFNPKTGEFVIRKGPIIGKNLVLADEINRATPKAQAPLLEAMQERQVTLISQSGEEARFPMEKLFLVLATMNPIEQEGTYPLPEAQLDRFCFKLILTYVSRADELKVLRNTSVHGRDAMSLIKPVISVDEVVALSKAIESQILVSPTADEYIVDIVRATRPGDANFDKFVKAELTGKVHVGASPRAEIWMKKTAQVHAALSGRDHVRPDDVKAVAFDVLRHRILLTQAAQLDGYTTNKAVAAVLDKIPVIEPKGK